jgi:hypothetical protein
MVSRWWKRRAGSLERALRDWELFWAKADEIRKGLAGRTFQDSAELIREDRER